MKRLLLLVSALFLSCSDLSSDANETLKDELPKDFKLSEYAKINADIVMSQVILDIQGQVGALYKAGEDDSERKKYCGNILQESPSFVADIYTEYMKCPAKGWNPNEPCSNEYSGNTSYTKDGKCEIGICSSGGWNELADIDLEGFDDVHDMDEYCDKYECPPLVKDELWEPTNDGRNEDANAIERYMNISQFVVRKYLDNLIGVMCKFVVPGMESAESAENYLKNFPLDSSLIEKHYFLIGRSEGRPYKYCANGESQERTVELALPLAKSPSGRFNDYSRYLFCYNESDYKVYVTEEKK
jgi:hypothetical protein